MIGDDPHHDYLKEKTEIKEAATPPPSPSPDCDENKTEENLEESTLTNAAALENAVSSLVKTSDTATDPQTPPPSPTLAPERKNPEPLDMFNMLAKSGSTDSAVEATEEVLEDLEEKFISSTEDEKENIDVARTGAGEHDQTCKNIDPNCDIACESEKISDLAKIEEGSDRRNLAEIKI